MLIDEESRFITARKHPKLVLVTNHISEETLTLSASGMPDLKVPLSGYDSQSLDVQIWKDECFAYYCGKEAEQWFSHYLQCSVRLVHMPPESERLVDPEYSDSKRKVSFADGFPFLLISETSLADLNRRMKKSLEMARFRPNLVIQGCRPYEEDSWKSIRIGDILFQVVKPCSRCVITTIDPRDGSTTKEPLRTLAKYRASKGKVYFGQNLIHERGGTVAEGMEVEVIRHEN
jgi:uncharacterized protein YcbX